MDTLELQKQTTEQTVALPASHKEEIQQIFSFYAHLSKFKKVLEIYERGMIDKGINGARTNNKSDEIASSIAKAMSNLPDR